MKLTTGESVPRAVHKSFSMRARIWASVALLLMRLTTCWKTSLHNVQFNEFLSARTGRLNLLAGTGLASHKPMWWQTIDGSLVFL